MRTFFISTPLFLALLLPSSAYAQEQTESGATLTGSGQVAEESRTETLLQDIDLLTRMRIPETLSALQIDPALESARTREKAYIRERQWEHRIECRAAIRRSNRDQILSKAGQCFRSDLLLDVSYLRKELQTISLIPMADPTLRETAVDTIQELIDAEMAIVDAVDTKLFTDITEMETAKKNLRINYREPYWRSLTHLQADRHLPWASYVAHNLPQNEDETIHLPGLECLLDVARGFSAVTTEENRLTAVDLFKMANEKLLGCREQLRTIMIQQNQLEEMEATETTE